MLAVFLVIVGCAAGAGIALGLRVATDSVRDLCATVATMSGEKKQPATLVGLEVDRDGTRSWTCRGAVSTPNRNDSVTVTGFRFDVGRNDAGFVVRVED